MADYIDRKALLDSICGNIIVTHRPGEPSLEIRGANKVINFIEEAPAVDVELVRHGKYIPDDNYRGVGNCNLCGAILKITDNYCSNCGAKMRGLENE